jgi:PAS domain S-box-containing protein
MEFDGIKILAIDDQPDNLLSLKALIKEKFKNSQVLTSLSGSKGIELALLENPDVILLDVIMPGLDGFEVCRRLKSDDRLSGIPVVFVTALKSERESRIKALDAGGDAFLTKPIDESELVAQIRTMVKIRHANREKEDINEQLKKLVAEQTNELNQTHKETLNLLEDLKAENLIRQKTEIALRESEEKYRLLIENANEAIYVVRELRIKFFNKACMQITGFNDVELRNKYMLDFFSKKEHNTLIRQHKRLINGEVESTNEIFQITSASGNNIWLSVNSVRIDWEGEPATLNFATNITEKKLAEEALEKSEMLLRAIIDNAPFEIWARDTNNIGILENRIFVDNFGSILGLTPRTDPRIDIETLQRWERLNHQVFSGKSIVDEFEFDVSGENRLMQQILFPIQSGELVIGIAGFNIDITEKKLAEIKMQNYNQRLEMAMQIGNIAWWEMDFNTGIIQYGSRKTEMLGYEPIGFNHYSDFMNIVHPSDYERCMAAMSDHYSGKNDKYEVEYRIRNASGEYRWFYDVGTISKRDVYGEPLVASGLVMDITPRKIAEEALKESREQLKDFAAHLQNVREEERVLLAREIHDELGQILVAMKIDLGLLKQNVIRYTLPDQSDIVTAKFNELTNLLENTIHTTRKIMTDLRPESLEVLGFSDAIKQYVNNFEERYHVKCTYQNEIDDLELESQQSLALFRIIQEGLNNIAKHARATEVTIHLWLENNTLLNLLISDNGIGIDETQKKKPDSYGLLGMNERVYLLEGKLTITGKKNYGTSLKVEMPYRKLPKLE